MTVCDVGEKVQMRFPSESRKHTCQGAPILDIYDSDGQTNEAGECIYYIADERRCTTVKRETRTSDSAGRVPLVFVTPEPRSCWHHGIWV